MAQGKTSWSRNLTCPIYTKLGNNSAFCFSPDEELLFAAEGILGPAPYSVYAAVYGSEAVEHYRRKYRLASEINATCADKFYTPSIFEFLQGFDVRGFTLSGFEDYALAADERKLPEILLDTPLGSTGDVEKQGVFNSYLGAAMFFSNTREYVREIFALAGELRSDRFYNTLDRYEKKIMDAQEETENHLKTMAPLEVSDLLLRKTMYRRGPYSFYTFSPTVFSRFQAARYMREEQFLFYTIRDGVYDNERTLSQLKALADDTRFRIITLLKERGILQGSDIARAMALTPPTVSHHMKLLREAGLVNEEADGNTKFYSLPTDLADTVTESLRKFLN